jgi:GAF domain-containing protein
MKISKNLQYKHSSVLRKFTILFILMSIIPLSVLFLLYMDLKTHGKILLTPDQFNVSLIFVVLGILLGYSNMRSIFIELINMGETSRNALKNSLSPEQIEDLSLEKNEIAALAMTFKEMNEKLQENVRSLRLARKTLHSIMEKVGRGIANMQNIDTFLELIMETVTDALSGQSGLLVLVPHTQDQFELKTVYGKDFFVTNQRFNVQPGTIFHKVITSQQVVIVNLPGDVFNVELDLDMALFEIPFLAAPLVIKNKIIGIIVVSGRQNGKHFEEEDVSLMSNLSSQTAVAIDNARLNKDMERTYFETISALALAVDAKDRYSRGHLDRVAKYCVIIGEKLGLDEEDIRTLRDAARLHDLGKIGIPDVVLTKEGPLNVQEWILMKKHPEIGESIIKPIQSLGHLCDIIRHHHEKLDGSGYPDGLKGEEVTPLVRVTTVADIYDALTSNRSYRSKMTREEAFRLLRSMDEQLDQDIVELFIEALNEKGIHPL